MTEITTIVMAVFTTVAIGALGLALGAVSKQLENVAWQIERVYRVLEIYLMRNDMDEKMEKIEDENE